MTPNLIQVSGHCGIGSRPLKSVKTPIRQKQLSLSLSLSCPLGNQPIDPRPLVTFWENRWVSLANGSQNPSKPVEPTYFVAQTNLKMDKSNPFTARTEPTNHSRKRKKRKEQKRPSAPGRRRPRPRAAPNPRPPPPRIRSAASPPAHKELWSRGWSDLKGVDLWTCWGLVERDSGVDNQKGFSN